MIKIIPAKDRHYNDFGWLKIYWLFSFDTYHDPENIRFGNLRVFNDDIVDAESGFPEHPHHEMEIITIPLSGELSHADSTGAKSTIIPGEVQRMSAGSGLSHSEFNKGVGPVHLFQIWIYPSKRGLKPSYDQKNIVTSSWHNRLFAVASGTDSNDGITLNADSTIYRAALDRGKSLKHKIKSNRGAFIYISCGSVEFSGNRLEKTIKLSAGDQARISNHGMISLDALENSELILIDVKLTE